MGKIAPVRLAEEWDNVGLQVGDTKQNVENVLLALDFNKEVLAEAKNTNCQLIITHHPLIFNGLKSVNSQNESGRLILELVQNEIALFSAHTNLDIAAGGLNDFLINKLPVENISLLKVTESQNYYKLVTFVPESDFVEVKEALYQKGAGRYKDYSHSGFYQKGSGNFKPLAAAEPYLGEKNKLNTVSEYRFETIVAEKNLDKIIKELLKVHPYQEPAWDLYRIENLKDESGIGRIADLKKEFKFDDLLAIIKDVFELKQLKYVKAKNKINRIALCSGSGADFIKNAYYKGADLYLTGDLKYHEAELAAELGMNLVDFGHYGSEKFVKDLLFNKLTKSANNKIKNKINFIKSELNTSPWCQ